MSLGSAKKATVQLWAATLLTGMVSSCATTKVEPLPPLPEAPSYVQVPHPEGLEYGDLMAIFTEQGAPAPASLKGCEGEFTKLRKATLSKEELLNGARELVKRDPTKYHWCFYGTLMTLETQVKEMAYIDERQKAILDAYVFITPIARAFHLEYQDSRYLRWAVQRYRRFSEYVFYRRLEPTPQTNSELVGTTQPWGAFRTPAAERGVLNKYGIVPEATAHEPPADSANPVENPVIEEAKAPAAQVPAAQPPVATAAGVPAAAVPQPSAPAQAALPVSAEIHPAITQDVKPQTPSAVAPVAPALPASPVEAKLQVPADSPPVAPIEMTPAPLTANPPPVAPAPVMGAPVVPGSVPGARSPASVPAAVPADVPAEMAPLPE